MTVNPDLDALATALGPRVRRDEPLARYTAMRVGGPADLLTVCERTDDVVGAVELARRHNMPWQVLGGGCNVLVADRGVRGLVIVNRAARITFAPEAGVAWAEAGALLAVLAREAVERGLAGLEWAAGLPGAVGGAVVGNAGAFEGDVASVLRSAMVLGPDGVVVERSNEWFEFEYRLSRIKRAGSRKQEAGGRKQEAGGRKQEAGGKGQEAGGGRREAGGRGQEAGGRRQEAGGRKQEAGGRRQEAGGRRQEAGGKGQEAGGGRREAGGVGHVVLAATFGLRPGDPEPLAARAGEILEWRKTRHPSGATMGSTFKNPPGSHAGYLIEQAGLRGARIGGAQISELHGNFFMNTGSATAADVLALIEHARTEVRRQFGVELELEIELVGRW